MAAPTGRPLPALMSFEDFMEDSLHHPAWGYYTDGRVAFGESNAEDDFTTFPVTMRPVFGALLARRLEALRRACMADEAEGAPFVVVELDPASAPSRTASCGLRARRYPRCTPPCST